MISHYRLSLIVLWVAWLTFLISGCDGGGAGGGPGCDDTAPVFTETLLEIAPYGGVDGSMAGAFLFDSSEPDPPFVAFGDEEGEHLWPNIEYTPAADAEVRSPLDATVVRVATQSEDSEIHLRTNQSSCFLVSIDHVREVTVEEGDEVVAGQALGIAGHWSETRGQVELQVNDDAEERYVCPLSFVAPEALAAWRDAHSGLMDDWEALEEDPAIYAQEAMIEPGCLVETLDYAALE